LTYTYEYPRPALTVDAVVFGLDEQGLHVLLVERANDPFAGAWALPGGFVQMDETLETAVRRELEEETGLDDVFLEQLFTFGDPHRDPRGRVVSVAYYALVNIRDHRARAATDAKSARWLSIGALPDLAFDHKTILETALERLKGKVRYKPIGFELLPKRFTLRELQHLYETVLGTELDKRNFRKKVLSLGFLVPLDALEKEVARRPARYYRFDRTRYRELEKKGFEFLL
jgi:8-oxo-dGTP diphosphatase